MTRWRLRVEYDGGDFAGWQSQPSGRGVQDAIERAVLAAFGLRARVYGAGRTDAGVHALAQTAHVDLVHPGLDSDAVLGALNHRLRPARLAVLAAVPVGDDFHARFSALRRRYLYRLVLRRAPLALEAHRAWRLAPPLDIAAMRQAAALLVGEHDFTTFRTEESAPASSVRRLDAIALTEHGDSVCARFVARSFLRTQVRSMMGALVVVGLGRAPPAEVQARLRARSRAAAFSLAPPWGLYLEGVDY